MGLLPRADHPPLWTDGRLSANEKRSRRGHTAHVANQNRFNRVPARSSPAAPSQTKSRGRSKGPTTRKVAILTLFTSVLGPLKVGDAVGQMLCQPTVLIIMFTKSDDGARAGALHLVASL